ncbi:hypothetical protein BDF22DRAFT_684854 [Syncephalis plumigaleata]|nr:hypothetical protein BDF22DRAFT_684854 [Syncephalis plumigaleata]
MYCFKASRFYLLLSLIIGQLIAVNASITITQLGGKTSTYPTFDQFFTKVPYYKYEGVIIPPIYNEEVNVKTRKIIVKGLKTLHEI